MKKEIKKIKRVNFVFNIGYSPRDLFKVVPRSLHCSYQRQVY